MIREQSASFGFLAAERRKNLSPLPRLRALCVTQDHGLRPWLSSYAAPRLKPKC
jgi:hypothetical protein